MPGKCAFPTCPSTRRRNKLSFFQFPVKEPKLCAQWVAAVNRKNWLPTTSSLICELHFECGDFHDKPGTKIKRLKSDVVPKENIFGTNFITSTDLNTRNVVFIPVNNPDDPDIIVPDKIEEIFEQGSDNITSDIKSQEESYLGPGYVYSLSPSACSSIVASDSNVELELQKVLINESETTKQEIIETLDPLNEKYIKLEKENAQLKAMIASIEEQHKTELKNQALFYQNLIIKIKNRWKRKLNIEKKKLIIERKKVEYLISK